MSTGEVLLFLLGAGATALHLHGWYGALRSAGHLAWRRQRAWWLKALPPVALSTLLLVLLLGASSDVRTSPVYLAFYLLLGGAWLALVLWLLPWVGCFPRDDAVERANPAAQVFVFGAGLGGTLAYAGANLGDGPGWWVVLGCAMLSTGTLFGLLLAVELLARPAEAVTVERDLATGARQGALAVALGLVLGRAVAGDWTGATLAILDFVRDGWPAGWLAVVAVLVHRRVRPRPDRPTPALWPAGVIPGLLYLGLALAWLGILGAWA